MFKEDDEAMVCDLCGEDIEDKGVVALTFEGDRELLCAFCFDEQGGDKKYFKVLQWGFSKEEEAIETLEGLTEPIQVRPREGVTGQGIANLFKMAITAYVIYEVVKALALTVLRSLGFIKVLQLLGVA